MVNTALLSLSPKNYFSKNCNIVAKTTSFLIFAFLKKKQPILTKQIIAGFLLALFVFVHGVKLFHHHHSRPPVSSSPAAKMVITSPDCFICDYHFMKDADGVTTAIIIRPLKAIQANYIVYPFQKITSVGLAASGRGPPAIV